ncbi:hypothetical protein EC957_006828 [Mortierella hygrophila]|uniref:Uncharacterized protein n=1 Tax=Mortierella hygrophila TaxID=979708 RepID=A0A9P6FDK3_9FUNG|nr:hypothetical protein EC957_006828 [Mortierella hygrophila]
MSSQHPLDSNNTIHQQTPPHSQPQDHHLHHQHPHEAPLPPTATTTTDIKLPLELGLHGTIAFLSIYAVCSILTTIWFQNLHGYTSLTALLLFLVTAASFVMAVGYMILAWWVRTTEGAAHVRSHLLLQRNGRLSSDVETSTSTTKPNNGEAVTLPRTTKLATRAVVRVSIFLISPLPRLCILIGLTVACFLAAVMQWYKIRNGIDCAAVAQQYRHFCVTTKAAVTSTTVAACFWIVWLGLWFRRSYSPYKNEQKVGEQYRRQESSAGHREEIVIAMPEEVHGVSRVADESKSVTPTQRNKDTSMEYLQNSQTPHSKSPQLRQKKAVDANDSSLGLGIDITATTNGDSGAGTGASALLNTSFDSSTPHLPVRSKFMRDAETASIAGNSATSIARESIFEREKPNPGRIRDHAKVFPMARASVSSLQEAAIGGSTRGTPIFYNAGSPAQFATGGGRGGSPFVSGATTPTTPRAHVGYVGKDTFKALNNLPRSSSMGAIANMTPTAPSFSTHASAIPNNNHFGESYNSFTGTPRSYRSMTAFPQSPADAAWAEQSMDEQLKIIRRKSFASDVMNSPGGSASMLESAQMNSPSLMATPFGFGGGGSEVGSIMGMGMGSPSSALSRSKGKFRAAFSSPSLNTLAGGSGRRRSSLGITSMINSIVNSPAGSDGSSPSSYYSPVESATTPRSTDYSSLYRRGSDAETTNSDNDGQSSLYDSTSNSRNRRQHLPISAQDLLRTEYGDLYPVLPGTELDDMESINPETGSIVSMGRPRSNSVSSAGTSRSSGGSSSHSTSNEQGQGRVKQPGPPNSFMNKVRAGAGNHQSPRKQQQKQQQQQQQQQQSLRNVGSNGKLTNKSKSKLNSKKFPSHGDLTKFSWDYRKDLPID